MRRPFDRFAAVTLFVALAACSGVSSHSIPQTLAAAGRARSASTTLAIRLRIANTTSATLHQRVVSSYCVAKPLPDAEIPARTTSYETIEVETAGGCRSLATFTAVYHHAGTPAKRLAVFDFTHFAPRFPDKYGTDALLGRGYDGLCATAVNRTRTFTAFEGQPPTRGCYTDAPATRLAPHVARTFALTIENASGTELHGLTTSSLCMTKTPGGPLPVGTKTETVETFGRYTVCDVTADFTTEYWVPSAPGKRVVALYWVFAGPSTTKIDVRAYDGFCATKLSESAVKITKGC